eukprot:scaffold68764_cov56-Attheya_sp.AAC.2
MQAVPIREWTWQPVHLHRIAQVDEIRRIDTTDFSHGSEGHDPWTKILQSYDGILWTCPPGSGQGFVVRL